MGLTICKKVQGIRCDHINHINKGKRNTSQGGFEICAEFRPVLKQTLGRVHLAFFNVHIFKPNPSYTVTEIKLLFFQLNEMFII